ncbi:hypothetical protein RJC95_16005 [Acinetobacter baumannii]|uniref:hypothetical protein n=1 Tax=Acinetobacter baumannii TaxID=470 RepID=UPI0028708EA8|nr:hypothetical protein [Acinetobacter baumannii]MDR9548240.1 hypothetical protein [Acinetobacter baumannii]
MQITIVSAGKIIPASELISATLRTDLVPIPASIEFTVQSTTELDSLLKEGEQLTVNDISHPFELIKVTPLKTQTIKQDRRVGGISAIVMNPPFGHAGTLAIQHIKKAFGHLYDGGRIVALVPRGSMDSKVDEFIESTPGAIMTAEIWLPQSTFKNAGTAVSTRIIIIEKHAGANDVPITRELDFTHLTSVEDLFSEIRDIAMPPRKLRIDEQLAKYELYVRTERSKYVFNGDGVDKPQIKNIMLKFWGSEVNEFDEIVMPYNKSAEIIKKIDEFEQENGTSLAA